MSQKNLWLVAAGGFLVATVATATTGQWALAGGLAAVALLSIVIAMRNGNRNA